MLTRILTTVVATALIGATVAPAHGVTADRQGGALIKTSAPTVGFSPNGDGRHDVARIRFKVLTTSADVQVRVLKGDRTILGPRDLGKFRSGWHTYRWDGRDDRGRMRHDGRYRVALRATRGYATSAVVVTAFIDTVPDSGRLVSTRPTIYPRATVVHDAVSIAFLRDSWNKQQATYPGDVPIANPPLLGGRLRVLDPAGGVVSDQTVAPEYTPSFSWDGRRPDGTPVPAGTYTAQVRVVDSGRNTTTRSLPLTVSDAQLVEQVTTTHLAAAAASRYDPVVPHGCNGCGEGCSPVVSARFAGGLSFFDCPAANYGYDVSTYALFQLLPGGLESAVDSYRVTVTGGPTTPGGTDVGTLTTLGAQLQIGPGDVSTTSDWAPVPTDRYPFWPDATTVLLWDFSTKGTSSYDVASFDVEYRTYVPAP